MGNACGVIGADHLEVAYESKQTIQSVNVFSVNPTPVQVALTQVGIRESGGRNRGPEVDKYLRCVGLKPERGAYAWCAAFVCWSVAEAYQRDHWARGLTGSAMLPIRMTAGVFVLWAEIARRCKAKPGAVFIIDHGMNPEKTFRRGHTGFVVNVVGDEILTVEGNTNPGGSREGDGVYARRRKIADMMGFIDVESTIVQHFA